MAGVEAYRSEGCDLIVAVGGGSPMDCAKGIGMVVGNPGHILDLEGVDEVPSPGPPLIFIPTTAGTSADVSQFAIVADTTRNLKIAIISKMAIPDIALVDPETTLTMPPELTAATGMDALCHAFESFVSTAASPLTDMAALSAVRLVARNLLEAYRTPDDIAFRENMMMASLMAGLSFSNASLGLVHAMAHSLGGATGHSHGECNAMLLERVAVFNYQGNEGKYNQLAEAMGLNMKQYLPEERASALANEIASFRKQLGITTRLVDMGISLSELPRLSGNALCDPCLATNPRPVNLENIETIFSEIYQ
jgi:alcohol dehydrogenase class IV